MRMLLAYVILISEHFDFFRAYDDEYMQLCSNPRTMPRFPMFVLVWLLADIT